ncbi:MAG: Phosphatidylinositol (PI) 3-kinase [Piccolia ochrophora]|nr:MAG: Phosphatidylinositol (PI) 3-kinase [Piccolia ochrophora]
MEPFSFAGSSELNIPVSVRVGSLEGYQKPIPFSVLSRRPDLKHVGSNQSPHSDLYVTVELWADSKRLTIPVQTAYKAFKTARVWNEWLKLPIDYSMIPLSSQLAITIWDLSPVGSEGSKGHHIPFGGTTLPLFDRDNTLAKGRQKCHVHRHKVADGLSSTRTPAVPPPPRHGLNDPRKHDPEVDELERLEKLFKKHEMGEIPRIDWLDQLVFRAAEKQGLNVSKSSRKPPSHSSDPEEPKALEAGGKKEDESSMDQDGQFTLFVDLPRFDFPIVFTDHEYPPPTVPHSHQTPSSSNVALKPPPEVQFGPGINGAAADAGGYGGRVVKIYDPEVFQRDNPCETKHRRLVRSHRTGVLDRDLKPNAKIRDELNNIMSYSPTHELIPEEKDLVWKFRHHLTRDKRALTKFVKSVAWHDQGEARQAVQIIPKWTEIDVDDALELLGPTFDNPAVRAYAVNRLRKADDEELLLYLLQLVQALKFEKISPEATSEATQDSSLARFLISRAIQNLMLGNYLHWYLMVECDDTGSEQGNNHRKLFARVEYDFMTELMQTPEGPERRKILLRQGELVTVLSKISKDIRFSRGDRPQKIERLKKFLADPKNELHAFDPPLPLPLDPSVSIVGCFPEESMIFKSTLLPLFISFKTTEGRRYPVIFKTGDDLRQDQLVIQIITLMDRLLLKENLDLKLTPYRILATGPMAGAVQFIGSMSLSAASAKYRGSILAYLKANNPDNSEPLGVRKETMDTFVKSCAGYCVITYILGVGDRHLDNLLVAPDGHFFHADFGFILGRDPKPFAPAMKLCKEMVEGMGNSNSPQYAAFKQYCFTAYSALRKSSNLILNLFSLMIDANIPDIRMEPDKAVLKVRDRFHLEMGEEEAIRHFEGLINDSANAIFPVVIDRLHGMMQNWRA